MGFLIKMCTIGFIKGAQLVIVQYYLHRSEGWRIVPSERMLATWGQTWVQLLHHSNKTLGSLALSEIGCEAACSLTRNDYGGVQTQMSTLCGTKDLILFLIWHPSIHSNIYFTTSSIYVLRISLNTYPINITKLIIIQMLCNSFIRS